uniref:Uncharacterized protein n=1 Tax=Pristionchus pacificus TaxID=54126 RepID=A0A2A6BDM0_PRIPA|eukprot:PDM63974.1 hypothetical protein PRIPAC_49475 [Pristionchus pacificus]
MKCGLVMVSPRLRRIIDIDTINKKGYVQYIDHIELAPYNRSFTFICHKSKQALSNHLNRSCGCSIDKMYLKGNISQHLPTILTVVSKMKELYIEVTLLKVKNWDELIAPLVPRVNDIHLRSFSTLFRKITMKFEMFYYAERSALHYRPLFDRTFYDKNKKDLPKIGKKLQYIQTTVYRQKISRKFKHSHYYPQLILAGRINNCRSGKGGKQLFYIETEAGWSDY